MITVEEALKDVQRVIGVIDFDGTLRVKALFHGNKFRNYEGMEAANIVSYVDENWQAEINPTTVGNWVPKSEEE